MIWYDMICMCAHVRTCVCPCVNVTSCVFTLPSKTSNLSRYEVGTYNAHKWGSDFWGDTRERPPETDDHDLVTPT